MNAPLRDSVAWWLDAFARLAPQLPGQRHAWLVQARRAAIERFAGLGFPTQRDEDWKYTGVAGIEKARFALAAEPPDAEALRLAEARILPESHALVFIDGRLVPELCRLGRLPGGVTLCGLRQVLENQPAGLEGLLAAGRGGTPFAELNLACMADGAYLRLQPGCVLEAPLQLLFVAGAGGRAVQPRNLILAAEGSSARVVEQHVGPDGEAYFTNAVTEVVLGAGATVEHCKLQEEGGKAFHVADVHAEQGPGSRFVSASFALGAALARVGITVGLSEGAACQLDGLYVADGRQHLDHHTCVDHRQPGTSSREFYKGVLAGAARAVFNGRVIVRPDAQKSDAAQSNHNLLLSEHAEVDTKPQLEIWADDVKCSHGATVGQLDEDQVFYLRSRGIGEGAARSLLTRAFAEEVIKRISVLPLQARIDELLQAKLPAA